MLAAQQEGSAFLRIRQDFFQLLQTLGGNHKVHLSAQALFGMVGPSCQTEAVHCHGGYGGIGNLKFHAVVDGPGLIVGHGENGAGNQLLQLVLGNQNGPAVVHVGQFRIILGAFGGNGKGGKARPDGHLILGFLHHHGDGALRHTPDNVAKETGRQNAGARLHHIGVNIAGNAGFHIVAGERNTVTCLAENAFNQAQAALYGHCPGGYIESLQQCVFFTGKAHGKLPFFE